MALQHVLVLGDSFIRRLREFVLGATQHFSINFYLTHLAVIKCHGIGGHTITKTIQHDLHVVESFNPDIVIIQLGSNDLIDDFLRLLHNVYHVRSFTFARLSCACTSQLLIVRPSCWLWLCAS